MVVKLIRWPSRPPLPSRKFEAIIFIHRIEGLCSAQSEGEKALVCEIKWKGQKGALSSLRRSVKRNFTKEVGVGDDGVVEWNEGFRSLCSFSSHKEGVFVPWEVSFSVLNGMKEGSRNKIPVVGTASLNLAEHAFAADRREIQINVSVKVPGCATETSPSLCLSISLLEWIPALEPSETVQKSIVCLPLSPCYTETHSTEKDEFSALKAGLRKMKTFTDYVSAGRAKKASPEEESSDGRCSDRSTDPECNYPFYGDSPDDGDAEEQSEDSKDDSSIQPFSYETLASANFAGARGLSYSNTINDGQDEFWIYYSNSKLDVGCYYLESSHASISKQNLQLNSKRNILSWKKRKLSFRSHKAKGEPLLKRHYEEEGGDDIDHVRRQLSSSDESSSGWHKKAGFSSDGSSISEFGDDKFAIGSWECKEVTCRDRQLKLQTQVFFASIDQRSERAAGESACTALVAVVADWLHSNRDETPIKSEFDRLIGDGSLEWRNLCANEAYIEQFPDKHFDLETILQAKIRPLSVVPEKSFIGFFHPRLAEEDFDFLHGAMSFDSIWDEISLSASNCSSNDEPLVFIVCWNDHFFVLKVEEDAYYIIDTLGERLYEGCNEAYILKFDKDTTIVRLSKEGQALYENPTSDKMQPKNGQETSAEGTLLVQSNESENSEKEEVVCRGKESCREYIKSFLAAIPIRELEVDIKKGLMGSATFHHRLQIEFHYTRFLHPMAESPVAEETGDIQATTLADNSRDLF
ncbi:hypothetical protein I3843_13G036800 [Carya illinoinensis]|uniref:C2 NT-type domain-containing protein n=1 Tax=Carya illinoinensis TaxID=32201 RepID=A0A8T1NMA5_CARIL|nr:uncharacterized protein LOC122291400 [Carya illinoinensis]KAG6630792.1 hypothetical protein CIPAW_13G045100 [Carya illinoinensis]KAG7948970.1 hypothetical protein I3843_13G036800 [Carya illinoinensis]